MQVLLIQDSSPEIRERIAFAIEGSFHARVREATNLANAVGILCKPDSSIDLVLLDPSLPDYTTNRVSFWEKMRDKPVVLILEKDATFAVPEQVKIVGMADRQHPGESLLAVIETLINDDLLKREDSEYGFVRIRTRLLLSMKSLRGDIFIRLSDQKFVKLFHIGASFGDEDFEKYTGKKNIQYLYLRESHCEEFVRIYLLELNALLANPQVPVAKYIESAEEAYETAQTLMRHMGFNDQVQDLAKKQVQLSLKAMGRSPRLTEYLKVMELNPEKYLSAHSSATAFIACGIASTMGWDSEGTYYKLSMAAFLHDITLENQKLAAVGSLAELEARASEFSPDEIRSFKLHTARAGELAQSFHEIPPDTDTIIFQHHERPDGSGFPRGLVHTQIAPLSCIFIIAHEFVHQNYEQKGPVKLDNFLSQSSGLYNHGNFKRVSKALVELLASQK